MPPKARVRAVRVRLLDRDLATTLMRGVGFRASCDCEWRSPTRTSYDAARVDLAEHRAEAHP